MVRDGYYYAAVLLLAGILVGWLTAPVWSVPCVLLAAFFLWFFRDPEREIPDARGAIVSPADGKVTSVASVIVDGKPRTRISIFLSVFDVHVNRSPVAGRIRDIRYQRGSFLNAMNEKCGELNEQNIVTVECQDQTVILKQIAGLLARRIVFTKKIGDVLQRGERVGMIKFGSRTDILLDPATKIDVKPGDRVKGGKSVLGFFESITRAETVSGTRTTEAR